MQYPPVHRSDLIVLCCLFGFVHYFNLVLHSFRCHVLNTKHNRNGKKNNNKENCTYLENKWATGTLFSGGQTD